MLKASSGHLGGKRAGEAVGSDPMSAYLKEYESLRAEQMKRLEFQHQAVNYMLIVLGVALSTFAATLKLTSGGGGPGTQNIDPNLMLFVVGWILLFLPLVTAPLGFIFFDNEMAIHSIGSHLNWRFKPKVVALLKSNPSLRRVIGELRDDHQDFCRAAVSEESLIFGASLDFFFLFEKSERIHRTLSSGKWILFLLPTLGPVAVLGAYVMLVSYRCGRGQGCWWEGLDGNQLLLSYLAGAIYLVDVLVCVPLLIAVWWTFVKYERIKRR